MKFDFLKFFIKVCITIVAINAKSINKELNPDDDIQSFSALLDGNVTDIIASTLQNSEPIEISSLQSLSSTKENEAFSINNESSQSTVQSQTTSLNDLSSLSAQQTNEFSTTKSILTSIVSEFQTDSFKSSLVSTIETTNQASDYLTSNENFSTTSFNDYSKKKPNNIGTILMSVFIPIASIAFLVFIFIGYKRLKPGSKKEKLTENDCIDDTYDVQMELDENFNNPVFTSNEEREI